MDRKALLARRKRLQRQRDAELRAFRARWRRRLNSVDRLVRAPATTGGITSRTKPGLAFPVAAFANALKGKVNGHRKQGVMEVVRQTLRHNRGFFTARTLVQFINQTRPFSVTERGIRKPLSRLCTLGEIKLVERGNGRKPHMYAKL
jgi:hypothetical protein